MSEISVTVNGSTTINPTVGNGDTVNVTIASTGERGPTGATGSAGPANTLTIGTVAQGTAAATITGTAPNQVLNLVLQKGDAGTNIELQASGTHIQWRLAGGSSWTNLVALSAITGPTGSTGAAGAAVELQASGTHIQWRYVGGSSWTNVIALSALVGATGATGPQGPQGPAGSVNLADETPQPLGSASAGTALSAARADHVHAVPSIAYSSLTGVPSTFAPASHTQAISTVTGLQDALDGKQAAGTYATLVGGTVPSSQLPSYVDDVIEYANLAGFPASGDTGKIYVARDTNKIYRWSGSAFIEISPSPGSTDGVTEGSTNLYYTNARAAAAAPVQSVAGRTGTVALTKGDVGLGSVDNTADAAKPISTAMQTALDGKAATSHTHSLANLTQSSATTGQVPTWNGTAWAAATPSGGGGGSYTLPTATDTVLGGIKVGSGLTITDGVLAATGGGGGGSGEDAVLRALFVPPAPTSVTATAGNAQAAVSWTAPTVLAQTPITDYAVQFSSNSGSTWTTFSDGTSTATSATVTGLTNGTAYTFRVAAVNGVGTGSYSTASASVTPGVASDPFFSSVALLLHADGSGSTFVDSSGTPKTITAYGNATQSATQSRWGGKSLAMDGQNGTYLSVPATGLSFGTGDFCIEGWWYWPSPSAYQYFMASDSMSGGYFQWALNGMASNAIGIGRTNVDWPLVWSGHNIQANTWTHVAVSRASGVARCYVNGTRIGNEISDSTNFTTGPSALHIGRQAATGAMTGYIDDLRITVGSARGYTGSTITVPTAAFPDSKPAFSDPSSLGPTLWLDASVPGSLYDATSGGSLVGSGGTVRRWEDQSGNGNHVTGSTGPTRSVASINSRDSLAFSSNLLTRSALNLSAATGASLFAVIKFATSGNQIAAGFGTDASFGGLTLEANLRSAGSHSATFGSNTGASENSAVGGTVNNNTRSLGAVYGSSTGTLYIGGASIATVSRAQSLNSGSGFSVGAFFGSGFALSGNICEIVYVPRAMTSGEISDLQAYFATKWGV